MQSKLKLDNLMHSITKQTDRKESKQFKLNELLWKDDELKINFSRKKLVDKLLNSQEKQQINK